MKLGYGKMMKIVERESFRICHVLEFVTGRQAELNLGL